MSILNFLKTLFTSGQPHTITEQCEKDPNQECASYMVITAGGSLHRHDIMGCCKYFDTTKRMTKATASCEPNKDYNGISFSESVVESSKAQYEKIKNISYVGPVCEANKVRVDE